LEIGKTRIERKQIADRSSDHSISNDRPDTTRAISMSLRIVSGDTRSNSRRPVQEPTIIATPNREDKRTESAGVNE
jgi:hypothetical protein